MQTERNLLQGERKEAKRYSINPDIRSASFSNTQYQATKNAPIYTNHKPSLKFIHPQRYAPRKSMLGDFEFLQDLIVRTTDYDFKTIQGKFNLETERVFEEESHSSSEVHNRAIAQTLQGISKKSRGCLGCIHRKRVENSANKSVIGDIGRRNRFHGLNAEDKSAQIRNLWQNAAKQIIVKQKVVRYFHPTPLHKQKPKYDCLIPPNCKFKIIWTLVMIVLLLYTAFCTPYIIAFIEEMASGLFVLEVIVDMLFFIDIILTFFTPYMEGNREIRDKCIIAKKYLFSWFIFDLVACIPFWAFEDNNSSGQARYNKLIRLLRLSRLSRLIRLLRLVRIAKVLPFSKRWLESMMIYTKIHAGVGRLLRALALALLVFHLFACLWFLIAKIDNFNPDTWVMRLGYRDKYHLSQYLYSFYWVIQTTTSVGYGDTPVVTTMEIIIAILLMAIGVFAFSYLMGNMSSILSEIDGQKRKLQEKIIALAEFAQKTKLPTDIVIKIKHHLEKNHENVISSLEQETLLKELPTSLRAEVISHTHKGLIDKILFLKGRSSEFLWRILPLFRPMSFEKDQIIFRAGDYADEIFFLLSGSVRMVSKEGYIFKIYTEGNYFGEIEILDQIARNYTVIAEANVELLFIPKVEYLEMLEENDDIMDEVDETAKLRRDEYELQIKGSTNRDQQKDIYVGSNLNMFNEEYLKAHQDTPKSAKEKQTNEPKFKKINPTFILSNNYLNKEKVEKTDNTSSDSNESGDNSCSLELAHSSKNINNINKASNSEEIEQKTIQKNSRAKAKVIPKLRDFDGPKILKIANESSEDEVGTDKKKLKGTSATSLGGLYKVKKIMEKGDNLIQNRLIPIRKNELKESDADIEEKQELQRFMTDNHEQLLDLLAKIYETLLIYNKS